MSERRLPPLTRELQPGIYVNADGDVLLDAREALRAGGWPATEENRSWLIETCQSLSVAAGKQTRVIG